GGGGCDQLLEPVTLQRLRELGQQFTGARVLGGLGEDLDEVLLGGLVGAVVEAGFRAVLRDMALEAEFGGGEGPLAAEDAEALAGVTQRGDLVGAEGTAEVGLAAEARRRTGEEVVAGALVAVVQAPAGM